MKRYRVLWKRNGCNCANLDCDEETKDKLLLEYPDAVVKELPEIKKIIIDKKIWENAITPGVYIHIITGKNAKEVLPKEPNYMPAAPQDIVDRLHKAGFHKIKGLTENQAKCLLNMAITEYQQGRPEPWKLQALINIKLGASMTVKERHAFLRTITREYANELLKRD